MNPRTGNWLYCQPDSTAHPRRLACICNRARDISMPRGRDPSESKRESTLLLYYAVHWIWRDLPTVSHKCHRPAAAMPSTEDDPCLLVWAWNTGLAIVPEGPLDIFEPVWCDRVKAHTAETRRRDNHQKDGKSPIIRLLPQKKRLSTLRV